MSHAASLTTLPPVIVGAGPAGIRAAETLVRAGLRPVLIDEAAKGGGQIYRQQPDGFQRPAKALYGFEASRAEAIHASWRALLDQVDYRPHTLVWNSEGDELDLLQVRDQHYDGQPWQQLILATGATDRILPFSGWTLPGVYTLGAAQIALKYQATAIGSRVVFAGTGPLLYLIAYQYAKAGVEVAAVLDSAPFSAKWQASASMLRNPPVFAKGLWYLGWLKARGIRIEYDAHLLAASGEQRLDGVRWRQQGQEHQLDCEGLGFGYALRSETQLADILDCRFAFDELNRAWLPVRDAMGRSSRDGVYLAGDGAGIMGADAAEWAGELAALAVLQDRGMSVDRARIHQLQQQLQRTRQFREALEGAFPFPEQWAHEVADDVVLCRCENVTVGEVRALIGELSLQDMNRLKAHSRVGMGRCQGRMCGLAATELLAIGSGQSVADAGRLRAQAPVKPLPYAITPTVQQWSPSLSVAEEAEHD
ncbi:(2Fe-2S)-binding protein [Pokkaliibacter plantistimulans]|uniref:(2Fe-2S)-binding protein n=1 Tax=Pokkaliibacter plantistimulans TaxID=1635171 RepID=A0ABX5LX72_9GAMM|nr:FAD/NAD(P)-binding oxidoreductase [Pokkaliibacter plantistimulans]PXF30782.1 (2Fe-2S)-binding protein [Pokkaliibacter plantistimulans]